MDHGGRTAAVSALAVQRLACSDASTLTIIGCGVQGRTHLSMIPQVLPGLREVRLVDTRRSQAEDVAADHASADFQVRAVADVEDAVRGASIVVSATAILGKPAPFIRDSWVQGPVLALPVDFDSAWEYTTFERADKFIVDSVEEMDYFRSIGYLPHGLRPSMPRSARLWPALRQGAKCTTG